MIKYTIPLAVLATQCASTGAQKKIDPYKEAIPYITGLKVPQHYKPSDDALTYVGNSDFPKYFDWRQEKGLTPVENQGRCGSCYAMATSSVLEDNIKIRTGKTVDLSEQYLMDCSKKDGKTYGCYGGWQVHDYQMDGGVRLQGGVLNSDWPYKARDGVCDTKGKKRHDYLVDWHEVSQDAKSIKYAIYNYGPIYTAVCVDRNFQQYRSGLFTKCSDCRVNHAVTLVGWIDDDGDPDNPYFILKNSWGENWGESGYMEGIKVGCNRMGYASTYIQYRDEPGPDPDPDPEPPDPCPECKCCCTPCED